MKIDDLGCLIREKYEDGHPGNYGDSAAETARAQILKAEGLRLSPFITLKGYVRHPKTRDLWPESDFSGDQFVALYMAYRIQGIVISHHGLPFKLTPAARFLVNDWFLLFNIANIVQGWLFNLSWRFADGGKIERSEGKVQDWLNFIIIFVYLKRMGKWSTLNQSVARCLAAVRKYYLEGGDIEPNSLWIFELYQNELENS